jgi:DNA modification methylase
MKIKPKKPSVEKIAFVNAIREEIKKLDIPIELQNETYSRIMNVPKYIEDSLYLIENTNHSIYAFGRWDNIYDYPKPKSLITWVKNNWSMGDLKHEHGRMTEVAFFYSLKDHFFPNDRPNDVIQYARTTNEFHPTEKPVGLIERFVSWTNGVVIDPFMGSGTTGIACHNLKRNFIGTIPKGTPIFQMIPIKRDDWDLQIDYSEQSIEENKIKEERRRISIFAYYKNYIWQRKNYRKGMSDGLQSDDAE